MKQQSCLLILPVLCAVWRRTYGQADALCGTPTFGKIVGGDDAVEGTWPWMGSLRSRSGAHICGATLIADQFAITAAHCVEGGFSSIVLGDLRTDVVSSFHIERQVQIFIHPEYNSFTLENDIAVLRLDVPVPISNYVSAACLSDSSAETATHNNGNCWITGWGATSFGISGSETLLEAEVELFTETQCSDFLDSYTSLFTPDVMICAGRVEGGADTCQGDSGGPLICQNTDGVWDLVGVTSFGIGCGLSMRPGVYARVSAFREFIMQTVIRVRLVGGENELEGRVEVSYNGEWGTVCDDLWDSNDATVVCRQLGFGDSGEAVRNAQFGQGVGTIWLDNVQCSGSESNLAMCAHRGWGVEDCGHHQDAGVKCESVRLVGGENKFEGRVEVFYDGEWGTVCDDLWDANDATVVCRQLGLGDSGEAVWYAQFGQGVGRIWLDNVQCSGSESSLDMCAHNGWGVENCRHYEDAGVRCESVRLVGGENEFEGRVEVFYGGEWGTICDDLWDRNDATVVCRQLGLGGSGEAVRNAQFGQGVGRIWLDNIQCSGSESSLDMCAHNGWGVENCGHHEDAGVRCALVLRLVGGENDLEGRVEVFYDGHWGTICDDLWDDRDATVVCRRMGLGDFGEAVSYAHFGQGVGTIWLDDVQCSGSESSLEMCAHNGWGVENCGHHEDAGVRCESDPYD